MKNSDNELDYNIVFNDEIDYDSFNDGDEEDECSCHHHNKLIDECEDEDCDCFNHTNEDECCGELNEHACDCDHIEHKNSGLHTNLKSQNEVVNDDITPEELERKRRLEAKLSKYKDFQFDDETDFTCELDPTKQCDNCGKCLEIINTDEKGYAKIDIDKIDRSNVSIEQLYKMYGLDDD